MEGGEIESKIDEGGRAYRKIETEDVEIEKREKGR